MSDSSGASGRTESAAPAAHDLLLGLVALGCRLDEPLGRGSSGTVYRARQLRLNRDVAVKLVPIADAVPGTESRFRREVRAIAALNHPNVVPLYDAGAEDGMLVLVMGLVRGEDLRALVRRTGPLTPRDAVAVVRQIGRALDVAHESGLVHRDVKPANILLSRNADRSLGTAYLADFGLARSVTASAESTVTSTGMWVGTPAYAAPEQRAGRPVGPAADLYALAGVLHFLLTGDHPGTTGRPAGDDRTRRLLGIADAGMATAPEDRYPSAAALVAAAEGALEPAPTVAGTAPTVVASTSASATTVPAAQPVPPTPTSPLPAHRTRSSRRVAVVAAVVILVVAVAAAFAILRPDRRFVAQPSPTTSAAAASDPASAAPSSAFPSASASASWPEIERGDQGSVVRVVQLLLVAAGEQVPVDGVAGSATVAALRSFQNSQGLAETGTAGAATWERLARTVQRGDLGPTVDAVQLLLAEAGHRVEADGRFGAETERAVAEFQGTRGLRTDGVVGPRTWSELVAP